MVLNMAEDTSCSIMVIIFLGDFLMTNWKNMASNTKIKNYFTKDYSNEVKSKAKGS
jgi:hypothetical protein